MLAGPPPSSYIRTPSQPTPMQMRMPMTMPVSTPMPTAPPNIQAQLHVNATTGQNQYRPPVLPPNFSNTTMINSSTSSTPMYPSVSAPPPSNPNLLAGPPTGPSPSFNSAYPSVSAPPPSNPNLLAGPPTSFNSTYPSVSAPPPSNPNSLAGPPTGPMMPNPYLNQPNYSSATNPVNQQPLPSARLDPEIVPNVVQVLEQSQEKIIEPFITNAPGLLPPLAGLQFVCQDQGSCNPRLMRSTIYSIPNSSDMVKQSQIPISLSISPLAQLRSDELEPPLANFDKSGPIRCQRCKAYMCPFMKFIDGGKRFVCCFCDAATDVADEYFNHLDHSGRRIDSYQRAELCLGAYEIPATKQYCKDEKWPEQPAYIFMIDVSYNSVRSGMVYHLCRMLRDNLLDYLPKETDGDTSKVRVGFATFDKQIHFYNINSTLGQPQMMIVSDLDDMFIPLLDGFLCSVNESRGVINTLLERIPVAFNNCQESETILAPAIQCGIEAFKAANCNGKMFVFTSTLPTASAFGKLANRDDKKLLGTEKEKLLLGPANDIYTKLGEECAQSGCAVDFYLFSNNYLDIATIGEVSRVSGGEIQKFDYFSAENDCERLYHALKRSFERTTVFDALMRVRTSTGMRPVDFLGNFYMNNTTEMIFGTLDADKSVCVELKHDDKLNADSQFYVQVALLYTSISGQRRLRILNLALTTTSSYASVYQACDLDAIINYTTKIALRSINVSNPRSIRENIINQAANMLACYRKHIAQSTTAGQLILPDTMKLLPVYVASLIKCDALIGVQTLSTDERSCLINRIMTMNVQSTSIYLYPRIYPLHTLDETNLPPPMIRCLSDRLSDSGAYVLDNGLVMYIWLGIRIDPVFIQDVLTHLNPTPGRPDKFRISDSDNPTSRNVRNLLSMIRDERHCFMKFHVIQQRDQLEPFFRNYLVEDKGFSGGASYVDFLYHLHREIRNIVG